MFTRPDGIVDFEKSVCIGCKACMAACPYDAIFINPEDHSAEKCNFCAHRIDAGLEPACVVVCPVEAILVGDLDDPSSRVAQIVNREAVSVRKPEKETRPAVFYTGAHQATLDPLAARRPDGGLFMWSEQGNVPHQVASGTPAGANSSAAALLAYDVPHRAPWDWRVSLYTWTKGIAAGAYLVAAALALAGTISWSDSLWLWTAPLIALALLAATGVVLIADLEHPARFYLLLTRPQWRSWLVRGAVIIGAYGGVLAVHLLGSLAGVRDLQEWLAIAGAPLAAATAVYTAYLFAQAKARDLWQSPLLAPHMLVQAVLLGAAVLLPFDHAAHELRWILAGRGARPRRPRARRDLAHAPDRARAPRRAGADARALRAAVLARARARGGGGRCARDRRRRDRPGARGRAAARARLRAVGPGGAARMSLRRLEERLSRGQARDARARRDVLPGPEPRAPRGLPAQGALGRLGRARLARLAARERHYVLVPTTCFNCESACGLLAYVDRETLTVRKFEGNPEHPGSRGRNCAKGPATINQVTDPDRILYPLRRAGARGEGRWERVSWDEALDDIARAHPPRDHRGAPERGHVPRRPPRRGRLHRARARGLGRRRAQLAHEHLLLGRARRLPLVDGPRPAEPRPRQRRRDPAHQLRTSSRATTSTRTRSGSSRPASAAPS